MPGPPWTADNIETDVLRAFEIAYRKYIRNDELTPVQPRVDGVFAVGIGVVQARNGKDAWAIKLYVHREASRKENPHQPIEAPDDGGVPVAVPVDVVQTGKFLAFGGGGGVAPAPPPVGSGASITWDGSSPDFLPDNANGTFGAVLVDSADPGLRRYILSANHVISQNGEVAGVADATTGITIAQRTGDVTLTSAGTPPNLDCAIARLSPTAKITARIPGINNFLSSNLPEQKPEVKKLVRKVGAFTGPTSGTIDSFKTAGYLPVTLYDEYGEFIIECYFEELIVVKSSTAGTAFALPGDSGSLVFSDPGDGTHEAVGLLIGADMGSGEHGFACPFRRFTAGGYQDQILPELSRKISTTASLEFATSD